MPLEILCERTNDSPLARTKFHGAMTDELRSDGFLKKRLPFVTRAGPSDLRSSNRRLTWTARSRLQVI
jgi:hypothetical protein